MARLDEDAQWIVLMGLLVSLGLFFLTIIVSQSVLVGQTTAEGVLEFPKNDLRDLRSEMLRVVDAGHISDFLDLQEDLVEIGLYRKNAVIGVSPPQLISQGELTGYLIVIHYNNGVTVYDETIFYPWP